MEGTLIEDTEADGLPKHSDGDNVAMWTEGHALRWTEDLGINIINLGAYLHDHWNEGCQKEIEIKEDRTFVPDWSTTTMSLVLPKDELIEAAKMKADEDRSHFIYVLGNWTYLARKGDHVADSSATRLKRIFDEVMENNDYNPPEDATTAEYGGGRRD